MKTIEEEFPPESHWITDHQLTDAYTRLRARAAEMQRAQDELTRQIIEYSFKCKQSYGSAITEYQKGILQGIDCALAFLPAPEPHQNKP